MLKTCTKCGIQKPADTDHFKKDQKQSSGLRPDCKSCESARHKIRYLANREKRLAQVKAYREANRDTVIAKQRAYHKRRMETDPETLRAKRAAYYQARGKALQRANMRIIRRDDPAFRVAASMRSRFWQFVKGKKQGGFQKSVGYTYNDLVAHIEAQFDATMSWDNYGSVWEIDHIRPVSLYDLPREAAQCWALSNLRPLCCLANKRKSNSLISELTGI